MILKEIGDLSTAYPFTLQNISYTDNKTVYEMYFHFKSERNIYSVSFEFLYWNEESFYELNFKTIGGSYFDSTNEKIAIKIITTVAKILFYILEKYNVEDVPIIIKGSAKKDSNERFNDETKRDKIYKYIAQKTIKNIPNYTFQDKNKEGFWLIPKNKTSLQEKVNRTQVFKNYERKLDSQGFEAEFRIVNDHLVTIQIIGMPKRLQGKGYGSAIMNTLCKLSDQTGITLQLKPAASSTHSRTKLIRFYSHFGFIENKSENQNENYQYMYRFPKKQLQEKLLKEKSLLDYFPGEMLQKLYEKYNIIKFLGSGWFGAAFLTNDNKVVKITTDDAEVKFYINKRKQNLKHFVKIYEIKDYKGYYIILKDYVPDLLNEEEKEIMNSYKFYSKLNYNNKYAYNKIITQLKKQNKLDKIYFLNQLVELKKELHISFNYNDLNPSNIGWKDNILVAFDLESPNPKFNWKNIEKLTESLLLEKKATYKYGAIMLNLSCPKLNSIQSQIDKKDLYEDDTDKYGIEQEQHITLLYGTHKEVTKEQVEGILNQFDFPKSIKGEKVSIFENEKYDVLKFDVEKKYLSPINKKLKTLPYTNEYPEYKPHMTIAYLKKGEGKKYVDMFKEIKDVDCKVEDVMFSHSDKKDTITVNKKENLSEKILKEVSKTSTKPLCVVDVQPGHKDFITFNIYDFCNFLNKHKGLIIYLFNGPDFGYESNTEIKEWLYEHEIKESVLNKIIFYEKNYGFFRGYLDRFGWDDNLTEVLTYMIQNNINHSDDLDISKLPNLGNSMKIFLESGDTIYIPDVLDLLQKYNNFDLCGGGFNECLLEIEILLTVIGKKFNKIDQFIY